MITEIKDKLFLYKAEIILVVFSLFWAKLFFYSHGNISTDIGREAIMPLSLLNGDVMYKDVLNIYGPVSYYINAFLYKMFGVKLETLYFAGSVCSVIFLFLLYKIFNLYMDKKFSLCLSVFIASACVYNSGLFNFIMPYSFAVIYALTAYTAAMFSFLLYIRNDNQKLLYFSALFVGFAFANKIEFFPAILIILFLLIFSKKVEIKTFFLTCLCFLTAPFIFYSIPLFQGLNSSDIGHAFDIFLKSSAVPSVYNFAKDIGTVFKVGDLQIWFISGINILIYLGAALLLFKTVKIKFLKISSVILLSVLYFLLNGESIFSYIGVIILLYLIVRFKKLLSNTELLAIILFGLGASLKTFFKVNTVEYGAYTFAFLFTALVLIILSEISNLNKNFEKSAMQNFALFLLIPAILSNLFFNLVKLNIYSYSVETTYGKIQTSFEWKKDSDYIIKSVLSNTKEKEKVLFVPEGSMFNFLCGRKTEMNMYALNMPYIETYGEDKIIEMINNSDIKYIAVLKGLGLGDYFKGSDYYFKDNAVTRYIQGNFDVVDAYKSDLTEYILLKRK